jgi:uncharacterized Tic20 family protein
MKKPNENSNSALLHISALSKYVIPFGGIIVPLIIWLAMNNKSELEDKTGKSILNFRLSLWLYGIIIITGLIIFLIPFEISDLEILFENLNELKFMAVIIGIIILSIVFTIIELILIIIGAVKASRGELYHYPLSIKFIK